LAKKLQKDELDVEYARTLQTELDAHDAALLQEELAEPSSVPNPTANTNAQPEDEGIGDKISRGWGVFSSSVANVFQTVKQKSSVLVQEKLPEIGQKIGEQGSKLKKNVSEFVDEVPKKLSGVKDFASDLVDSAKREAEGISQKSSKLVSNAKNFIFDEHPIFGVPLADACHEYHIPLILEQAISRIEEEGLGQPGIFVKPPDTEVQINDLKKKYDSGENVDLSLYDVHVVAALLVEYFRMLPQPLLGVDITHLNDVTEKATKVTALHNLVYSAQIPKANRIALKRLTHLLRQVHEHAEINKTALEDEVNLFGQAILVKFGDENSHEIVSVLITEWEAIFGEEERKEKKKEEKMQKQAELNKDIVFTSSDFM